MTTPGPDSFDYTDDSVIARVAIDVPSQAVTDITQLSTAMSAMRTQLEAIARAQGDWLDYLQQVPVIAERANAAFRDQITQLERMSYIQNELGNSGGMGGGANVGSQPQLRTSGSPGGTGYSTAAPPGFVDNFRGAQAGMGANRGAASYADFAGQLAGLANEDPRMMPNAASARGLAINPSLAGFLGGAAGVYFGHDNGGMQGKGDDAPGSESPQPSQKDRTSAGRPDPNQLGQTVGAEPQRHPASPGNDASAGQQLRDSMWNEVKKGFGGSQVGQILGSVAPALIGKMWSGGGPPSTPSGGGGGLGGMLGKFGGLIGKMGPLGMAGAGVGLALGGYGAVQNIGERVTRAQALGSEEGGDYATGAKEELRARMLGLDPFITTEDARKAIQMPMSQGFKGESRDEIRDFLIQNFKELGVSMAQSAAIEFSSLKGQKLTDENVLESRSSNEATMNVMKELAGADGNGMSQSQRINQLEQLMKVLTSSGGNPDSIRRSALQWQEGYGNDSMALRENGSSIIGNTMRSGTLMTMVGQQLGVTGIMAGAMEAKLTDMGYSETEITEMAAAQAAKYVSGLPDRYNRIASFQGLMRDNGVDMDWPTAKDLYDKVTSGKSGSERANEIINRQSKPTPNGRGSGSGGMSGQRNADDSSWAAQHPDYEPSENAERVGDSFSAAEQKKNLYAPSGQNPRQLPQTYDQMPQRQTINTQGQVTGNVTITVDQQGRVGAPPVIQLSGTQQSVNAGYGSSQLNNAPPGDPLYNHAHTGLSGGGSG